ncbi:glyceraldehyde-3-phosphate dehydrogenase [Maritimibacter sp. DP1N21-5]|nr:glyceraldehyde-3-phosphate dehydrogenase [Maritimibacter sp. DP1N21-5]MBV7409993.1 glyceraldehyde-3-phosphate dehydrogenase [Maritimibacter sp. DP1N21-5]
MTNRVALILFLVVALAFAGDLILNEGAATLFLAKKLYDLLDWIAFWR